MATKWPASHEMAGGFWELLVEKVVIIPSSQVEIQVVGQ